MANFIPTKHEANEYNGGVQYINSDPAQGIEGDALQAKTVNNLVESALYTQIVAENAIDIANDVNDKIDDFIGSQDAPPPVGYHYIQFNGEPTPASRWAGTTWTIDTDYQGKVLVGSGGSYTLGATGGNETHNHLAGYLYAHFAVMTSEQTVFFDSNAVPSWAGSKRTVSITGAGQGGTATEAIGVDGTTALANNMPPYAVVNYWKRTA